MCWLTYSCLSAGSISPTMRLCGGDDHICPPGSPAPISVCVGCYTANYLFEPCPPGERLVCIIWFKIDFPSLLLDSYSLAFSLTFSLCLYPSHRYSYTHTHSISHIHTLSLSISGQWRNNSGLALDPTVTQSSPYTPSLLTSLLTDYSPITTTTTVPQCQLCPDGTHKSVR